jgi:hypothetical protein
MVRMLAIERPIEEVFALLADARNGPLYNTRILKAGARRDSLETSLQMSLRCPAQA